MLELKLGYFYKLNDYLQKELNVGPIVKIVAKIGQSCSIQESQGRVFTIMTSLLANNAVLAKNITNFSGTTGSRRIENEEEQSTDPNSDESPESSLSPEQEEDQSTVVEPEEDSEVPQDEPPEEENQNIPPETEEDPKEDNTEPEQVEPEDNPYDDDPYGDGYI